MKGKDEAAALVAVLQNTAESSEARTQACEAVLALSKSDVTCVPLHRASHACAARSHTAAPRRCAVLCSVGGIHAVVNAVKGTGESSAFLKSAALALSNLYRFDQKLVSVVVRLQGGIGALLEALREYIHCGDVEFLQALLIAISDVSNNAANAQQLVKEGGTAVVLASVLAHLKSEALLLPSLQVRCLPPFPPLPSTHPIPNAEAALACNHCYVYLPRPAGGGPRCVPTSYMRGPTAPRLSPSAAGVGQHHALPRPRAPAG